MDADAETTIIQTGDEVVNHINAVSRVALCYTVSFVRLPSDPSQGQGRCAFISASSSTSPRPP
jgi:hypothetical protein